MQQKMFNSNLEEWYDYNASFVEKLHGTYPQGKDLEEYLSYNTPEAMLQKRFVQGTEEWNELPMDMDLQLKLDFALYLINDSLSSSASSVKGSTFFDEVGRVNAETLREMAWLLVESMPTSVPQNSSGSTEDVGKVEQITSYLISSALSKGINLANFKEHYESSGNTGVHDAVSFCKHNIDLFLKAFPVNSATKEKEKLLTSSSDLSLDKGSTEQQDLQTAINDLKMAYKFLRSKYENDRSEYLSTIETLNRTNRELSEELLHYHSKLKESNERSQANSRHLSSPSEALSPLFSELDEMNSSLNNASTSQSFNMMKQEFKRILADTQSKYEKELQQERGLRAQLEQQLRGE